MGEKALDFGGLGSDLTFQLEPLGLLNGLESDPQKGSPKRIWKEPPTHTEGCHSLTPKVREMALDVGGTSLTVLGPQPGPQPPWAMT